MICLEFSLITNIFYCSKYNPLIWIKLHGVATILLGSLPNLLSCLVTHRLSTNETRLLFRSCSNLFDISLTPELSRNLLSFWIPCVTKNPEEFVAEFSNLMPQNCYYLIECCQILKYDLSEALLTVLLPFANRKD